MDLTIYDDKIKLDACLSMPRNYDGSKKVPITLIIHGFTGNKDEAHLLAVSDMLNDIGIATLRVDMYGHGRSDGKFYNHTLYKWIQNGLTCIDYIKEDDRFSELYLCGHSQGGLTVILLAAMAKDKVDLLIPLSPATTIPEGCRRGELLGIKINMDNPPEYVRVNEELSLSTNYARVAATINVEEAVAKYLGPVLVVHGDSDTTIDINKAKKTCEGYANLTFVPIEGDSHCFDYHLDKMVEAVKKYVLDYTKGR